MRKITLLSLVAATLVFTACGEDTKVSEAAVKAKAERTVELEKMAADKITAKAAEKAEVAQIRAAEKAALKAAVKAKAEKEAAEAVKREAKAKAIAAEVAKKEAEAKVAAEKAAVNALKKTNATTDASIIEAANKEIKAAP